MKYPVFRVEERTFENRMKRKIRGRLRSGPVAKVLRKFGRGPAPSRTYPTVIAALVGVGNIAKWAYLPAIRAGIGFRLAGVYDPNTEAARSVAADFSATAYASLDDLMGDDDVAAVVICSPPRFHREAAVAALQAGKHVLCEKPLSDRYEDAKCMWEVAQSSGVRHMVNFSYRYRADIRHFAEIVHSGILGTVYHVSGDISQGQWFTESGDPSHERGDDAPWRYQAGGGVVLELGSHLVDLLRLCFGEVSKVQAWTESCRDDSMDCENACGMSLVFKRGPVAHVLTSRFATGFKEHTGLAVSGSRGCLVYDQGVIRLWTRDEPRWRDVLCPPPPDGSSLAAFHRAIHDPSSVVPGFWEGYKNSEIIEGIFRCAASGQSQRLPLS